MSKKTIAPETEPSKSAVAATEARSDTPGAMPAVDLSAKAVQDAISQGKALIADGKSKADAARAIFGVISGESKELIVAAFVEGATLTPKGALTYWYNCKRRAAKQT